MKLGTAGILAVALSTLALAHPHFPKKIEMTLGFDADAPIVGVTYNTVTFNKEGFEKAKEGDVWHLAGAGFETTDPIKVGGKEIKNGKYRLLTRLTKSGDWELVIDAGGAPFDPKLSDRAVAIATKFEKGQPVQEHLRIDLQPSGDKSATAIFLEVHFDQYKATSRIEAPAAEK